MYFLYLLHCSEVQTIGLIELRIINTFHLLNQYSTPILLSYKFIYIFFILDYDFKKTNKNGSNLCHIHDMYMSVYTVNVCLIMQLLNCITFFNVNSSNKK